MVNDYTAITSATFGLLGFCFLVPILGSVLSNRGFEAGQNEPNIRQVIRFSSDFEREVTREVNRRMNVIDRFNSYADQSGNGNGCASLVEQLELMETVRLPVTDSQTVIGIPYDQKERAVELYEALQR